MFKHIFSLIVVSILSFSSLSALESQIILINSEAYLVDLDDNFDVINIHERIPEYFQDHSSHEEILASYKRSHLNKDVGQNCNYPKSDLFLENNLGELNKFCPFYNIGTLEKSNSFYSLMSELPSNFSVASHFSWYKDKESSLGNFFSTHDFKNNSMKKAPSEYLKPEYLSLPT